MTPQEAEPYSNMTFLPVTTPTTDEGLNFTRGVYYAAYEVDGRRLKRSLGTSDIEEARTRRDEFYAGLVSKGAAHVDGKKGRTALLALAGDSGKYVYRQPRYLVRVHGVPVGSAESRDEAVKLRDAYLRKKFGGSVPEKKPKRVKLKKP